MSGAALAILPTKSAVDAAWERYASITGQAIDDPKKLLDREFLQATLRAHEEFRQVYLAWLERQ